MEKIQEAIIRLPPKEQSRLREWIYATEPEPGPAALEWALDIGLRAAREGRVKPVEEVRALLPKWAGK